MLDLKIISSQRHQCLNIVLLCRDIVVASYSMTPDGSAFTRLDINKVTDMLKVKLFEDVSVRKCKEICVEFNTYDRQEALYQFGCFVTTIEILTGRSQLKDVVLDKIYHAHYNTIFLVNVMGDYCESQKIDNEAPTFISNFTLTEKIPEGNETVDIRLVTNRKTSDHGDSIYSAVEKLLTFLKMRQF